MALPSTGAISLNAVNVELGLSGTTTISLNQASVRTLFGVASGAIRMSDGYGKSNATGVSFNSNYNGGNEYICEWDAWEPAIAVSGTRPIYWELVMYSNNCGNAYAISSGNSGGTGYTNSYIFQMSNASGADGGTYTGGANKYKAAHYKFKVWNSVNTIYSGAYHVNYGQCSQVCNGTETCTDNCCQVDCSGDCSSAYQCRAECDQSDYDNCIQNGCSCWPSACGQTCTCSIGYDTVYDFTNYAPNGTCT